MYNDYDINDDFFTKEYIDTIKTFLSQWDCRCIKDANTNLFTDTPFWRLELTDNSFFAITLANVIKQYYKTNFNLKRVYAVSQTYEQNSNYHTDDNNINCYTFVLYITDNYSHDDGYFYIKLPNKTVL